jgi:hypothetical protein
MRIDAGMMGCHIVGCEFVVPGRDIPALKSCSQIPSSDPVDCFAHPPSMLVDLARQGAMPSVLQAGGLVRFSGFFA